MSAEYAIIQSAKGGYGFIPCKHKKRSPRECQLLRASCHFSDRPCRGSLLRLLVLVEPFAYVVANYRCQYRHKKGDYEIHANTSFLLERVEACIL